MAVLSSAVALLSAPLLALAYEDFHDTYPYQWIVVDQDGYLNCRKGPGAGFRVVTRLKTGARINLSPDETEASYDASGKPWLRVDHPHCYVRASSRHIIPNRRGH